MSADIKKRKGSKGQRLVSEGSNLLKARIPYKVGGGGGKGVGDQLPTLMLSPNLLKSQSPTYRKWDGGGGGSW